MLRRVWFSKRLKIEDDLVSAQELGVSPFALVVEYVPPRWGVYRARLRVKPRDGRVSALIAKHKLRDLDVYIDQAALRVDEKTKGLKDEARALVDRDGPFCFWSFEAARLLALGTLNAFERSRVVRVSFAGLLAGMEISGRMDEVSWCIRELTQAIDKLGAKIATGETFDAGEIRVFAPGSKAPVEKPVTGTRPSKWVR